MILKRLTCLLVIVVALPYFRAPVYRFPSPQPFNGPAWLNPYARLAGTWQRANLHAHGRAWSGITNGRQSDAEVAAAYRRLGYTVTGISDYHLISSDRTASTLPVYEHGYNVGKRHQLAIGARSVDWFDVPFWQWRSQKQYVLDRLDTTSALVAINHPTGRGAYTPGDMAALTNYELLEVVNGPFTAEGLWDAALSSGRAVWVLADDDTHDVTDPGRLGVAWDMIDAATGDAADVIAALGAGRSYAVLSRSSTTAGNDAVVSGVEVRGGRLVVTCEGAPADFTFVGQNGVVRKTVDHATSASYDLEPSDTYVRTTVRTPATVMFLNPIVRYNGVRLAAPEAAIDETATWLLRALLALACAAAFTLLWRRPRWTP